MTDDTTPQNPTTPESPSPAALDAPGGTTPGGTARRRSRTRVLWIGSLAAGVLVLGGAGTAWALSEGEDDDTLTGTALDRASEVALAEVGDGTVTDAERTDDGGYELEITRQDGRETDVLLDGDYDIIAIERSGEGRDDDAAADDDRGEPADDAEDRSDDGSTGDDGALAPLTDDEIARAGEAALAATGAGEAVDVDRSDDPDHAFEVEVRLADGAEVDVELDESFAVVRSDR